MIDNAVVIARGGPTGMMLAAELRLAGTDVIVVERRPSFELESPRSRGLHSRTIEVLDRRGVVERFLAEGTAMQVQAFAGVPLDISDFPSRHNYGLALLQSHFERIMFGWIDGPVNRPSKISVQRSDASTVRTTARTARASFRASRTRRVRRCRTGTDAFWSQEMLHTSTLRSAGRV